MFQNLSLDFSDHHATQFIFIIFTYSTYVFKFYNVATFTDIQHVASHVQMTTLS